MQDCTGPPGVSIIAERVMILDALSRYDDDDDALGFRYRVDSLSL